MTGNQTYFIWANKIYDWSVGVGLVDKDYNVYDGTDDTINCSQVDHDQWQVPLFPQILRWALPEHNPTSLCSGLCPSKVLRNKENRASQ